MGTNGDGIMAVETDGAISHFHLQADPLGKVADWTGNAYQDRRFRGMWDSCQSLCEPRGYRNVLDTSLGLS